MDSPAKIHQHLLESTSDLFNKIYQTPVADHQFTDYIGRLGQKQGVDEILQGNVNYHNLPPCRTFQKYISHLHRPSNIPDDIIDSTLTPEEYKKSFCKTNENTVASLSGVNYSHYIETMYDDSLIQFFALRTSLPFNYPISVKCWKMSHHILLPKTQEPTLHKMRNIQIVEADYNTYLKVKINHQLFQNSKTLYFLQDQMYGGLQNKSTHLALSHQTLINDATILQKSSAYITQLDAANFYDQMAANLSPITLTRLGAPKTIGQQLARNSILTKHKVITEDGTSVNSIKCTTSVPWSGIGQGNSAAGATWISIESPMIKS